MIDVNTAIARLYKFSQRKYVQRASYTNSKEFKLDELLSKPKPEFKPIVVGVDGNAPRT
jgi:hypothetical protein